MNNNISLVEQTNSHGLKPATMVQCFDRVQKVYIINLGLQKIIPAFPLESKSLSDSHIKDLFLALRDDIDERDQVKAIQQLGLYLEKKTANINQMRDYNSRIIALWTVVQTYFEDRNLFYILTDTTLETVRYRELITENMLKAIRPERLQKKLSVVHKLHRNFKESPLEFYRKALEMAAKFDEEEEDTAYPTQTPIDSDNKMDGTQKTQKHETAIASKDPRAKCIACAKQHVFGWRKRDGTWFTNCDSWFTDHEWRIHTNTAQKLYEEKVGAKVANKAQPTDTNHNTTEMKELQAKIAQLEKEKAEAIAAAQAATLDI